MPDIPSSVISFGTTEGTLMNIDVSPDGETLIFDLLGDIYRLPLVGGDAVALTNGRAWDQAPRFSPDGTQISFISDRKGHKNIWRLTLGDRSLEQVTRSDTDIVGGLNWSHKDGRLLAGRIEPESFDAESILQSIDPNNGSMSPVDGPSGPWINLNTYAPLRPAIRIYSGVESADGEVFFSQAQRDEETGRTAVRIYKFDRKTQTRTALTSVDATYNEYKPQLSRDGRLLAYFRQYPGRRTEVRILNRTTRQDEALIELANADDAHYYAMEDTTPNYTFTPSDRSLIYWHGGKIHRVNIEDGSREIVPFQVNVEREVWARVEPTVQHLSDNGEAKIVRWPSVSRDGHTMAFAALGYVWVMDLTTGKLRRVTGSNAFEYMPDISVDGRSVAYVSFTQSGSDYGPGRLMVADVDGGTPREVLAAPNVNYLLPKWSQDGQKIALIREAESGSDLEASFGWTSAMTGAFHEVAPAPASGDFFLGWFVYSRFVGFDEAGQQLLFSYPTSRTETVLVSTGLDGSAQRTLAIGKPDIGGITPAPDLNNLALTRHDRTVWVVPFTVGTEPSPVSTLAPDARRISNVGGYYVDWNRPGQLTFGFAQNVYRYRLDDGDFGSIRVKVPFPKPKAEQRIAFTGARLITLSAATGAGPVIESGTVVVDGARIAAIGPVGDVVIPSDALVIDVTGKTIMPGLLDTHYHRIGGSSGGIGISAFKLPNPDFSDRSAIVYGVTSAWEPGGPVDDGVPATADLQAAGRIAGPRWSHSAKGTVGSPFELLTTYDAALRAVEQHKHLGVDVLKEYATPTREQTQWLSAAAYETGLGIVSHLESFEGMMTRVVDGYTGGDHPYIPVPFYKDVHELIRQTGYIWTPNVAMSPGTVGTQKGTQRYFCQAVLAWQKRTSPRVREVKPICATDQSNPSPTVPYGIQRNSRVAKHAALTASDGVHIGVSAHSMPASNLHREMWFLWKGGLPIEDVLRATTIGNAEKLGLQEEIGSLEPGNIADFLVLERNPLDDILNTLSLKYTIQGGVVYDSDTALTVDLNSIQTANIATLHERQ